MTLAGTRPPLVGEVNLYELHHRARLREIGNSVGIVGARRCSQKMKQKCVEIAQSYIRQGIAIVSGMAKWLLLQDIRFRRLPKA